MSAPDREKPADEAAADDSPGDAEPSLPPEGKPLPPPPPLSRVPAAPIFVSSPVAPLEEHLATEVELPQGLGSVKPTIVGIPVPGPSAPDVAPEREPPPGRMSDIATSDPEIPLTPGPMSGGLVLLAKWRREILLGSVAMVGLMTGFSVVRSLAAPRSHTNEPNVSIVALPPTPVPGPPAGGSTTVATAVDVPPASPVATTPQEVPPPATAPSAEAVAKPVVSATPTAARASASPVRPPPPVSTAAGRCNPPYRVDFFGKRVPKPGC